MAKAVVSEKTVVIPKEEYGLLKELYKTVKRQQLLFRQQGAIKNLKTCKGMKVYN